MRDSQLEKMSVKDLRALRDRIDEALKEAEVRNRAELRAKMAALAADHGMSLADILGGGRRGGKGSVAIKYRNPKNSEETWTGRGRRPKWMTKAGGDPERFRV